MDRLFVASMDEFLDELTTLSRSETERNRFYQYLTARLQNILAADHVSIWMKASELSCVSVCSSASQHGSSHNSYPELTAAEFDRVIERSDPVLLDGRQVHFKLLANGSQTAEIPHSSDSFQERLCIAHSIGHLEQDAKLITVNIGKPADPQMIQIYCDLVAAVADIAAGLERRLLVEQQRQKFARLESFIQLINNSHSSLDPVKVACNLTNDCRVLLAADRVWLFEATHRLRLLSCSSVSDVNRRSPSFKQLRNVVRETWRRGISISHVRTDQKHGDLASRNLKLYLESESIHAIHVILLHRTGSRHVIGALVVECLSEHDSMSMISTLNNVAPCVQSALSNALTHSRLPFRRSLLAMAWILDQFKLRALFRTLAIAGLIAALTFALFGFQSDFNIEVNGELRPQVERNVFSPADGTVESVDVDYGDLVRQGQPLVQIVSPENEIQIKRLQGELSAARKELEANLILRSNANQEQRDAILTGQLTAKIEQNRLAIEALNRSIALYLELAENLKIQAPIDGQVISRDVKLSLLNRPISGGSRLLTIADSKGTWHVVFRVPDREFGYLQDAIRSGAVQQWKVSYRLKSDLATTVESLIERVDENNSFDDQGTSFVKAFAPVDNAMINEYRVGQSVVGQIYCGKKSLFFIWTRDIRDFLRSNFLWT